MALLADAMQGREFRMIYEANAPWMSKYGPDRLPADALSFDRDRVPKDLSPGGFEAVVFSTVQPRPAPLNLLHWALWNDLPAIAIQESNQLALSSGRFNNYLAPVDHVLVASASEQAHLAATGVDPERIEITGWPFYTHSGPVPDETRRAAKMRLGLDPESLVAVLTLTAYRDSGESEGVRIEQLRMAREGLSTAYQLVIKPHPIESMTVLRRFVEDYARGATILDGTIPIDDLLNAADVLLNRGVSQVCFEALLKAIPVVVLDVGDHTPFHDSAPRVVASDSRAVSEIVRGIEKSANPMAPYRSVLDRHMPFTSIRAKEITCERISSIIETHSAHRRNKQWLEFALTYAWQVDRHVALSVLRGVDCGALGHAMSKLMRRRATEQDLELLVAHWRGQYAEQMLLCLLCEQLRAGKRHVEQFHLDLMRRFISPVNLHLYCRHYELWGRVLLDGGHVDEYGRFREALESRRSEAYQVEQALDRLDGYNRGWIRRCLARANDGRGIAIRLLRRTRHVLRDPLR